MSERKILSRRETEAYILKDLIKVNGEIVRDLGRQVDPAKDKVEIVDSPSKNNHRNRTHDRKITIAFNKPRGIVSSKSRSEGKTIFDLVPQFADLNAVGRLDKESEGLILLSNDGVVTSAVTGDDHKVEKEYEVSTREPLKERHIRIMARGMKIDNEEHTLPAKVELLSDHAFKIILKEGKRHQIRRMCSALNLTITNLRRTRIGNIFLLGISAGRYKTLSDKETERLKLLAK